MKKIIIMGLIGLFSGIFSSCNSCKFVSTDAQNFAAEIVKPNVTLVDVRTPEEYNEAHLKGAVNINVFDDDFVEQAESKLDKTKTIAVYCRSGKRSVDASNKLTAKGFKVLNLNGGFMEWTSKGFAVE